MALQLNTPPAAEPVSLAEAKAWLKLDTGDDDVLVSSLISAARARAEWHTGRAFVTQVWTLWLDGWCDPCIEIPLPPLQSVSSLTLYARDDSASVLGAGLYSVDTVSQPGRVVLKPGTVLANLRFVNAVAIAFHRRLWRGGRSTGGCRPRDPDDHGGALRPSRRRSRADAGRGAGAAGALSGGEIVIGDLDTRASLEQAVRTADGGRAASAKAGPRLPNCGSVSRLPGLRTISVRGGWSRGRAITWPCGGGTISARACGWSPRHARC